VEQVVNMLARFGHVRSPAVAGAGDVGVGPRARFRDLSWPFPRPAIRHRTCAVSANPALRGSPVMWRMAAAHARQGVGMWSHASGKG